MRCVVSRSQALGVCTLAAAVLLAGCGWTPRDEFISHRQVVLSPSRGDGSRITANFETRPGRATTAQLAAARRAEDQK
jgi:hypothetical protein